MATYCKNSQLEWDTYGSRGLEANLRICVSTGSSNVPVDLTTNTYSTIDGSRVDQSNIEHDWQMYLQRYNNGIGWVDIGSRDGYVSNSSPTHRTFTNVKKENAPLRVKVQIYWGPQHKGDIFSTQWAY